MKILPVGAELFHDGRTGGRTDMTKLIVAFRNFANAPKNDNWPLVITWHKAFPYIRFKCHAL